MLSNGSNTTTSIKPSTILSVEQLQKRANDMRIDIVRMIAKAASGHPGGSLSCIDILCALYFGGVMEYNVTSPADPMRDRFILAKGHAAPALYAALAHAGFFERSELATLRAFGSRLQGHPDSKLLPGVEVSTGSLGQGLSVACGMACGLKLEGNNHSVFTLLGDGECQEGQVWEAAMFAAHNKLDNLVAIVDRNELQIDGSTEAVCALGDIASKFRAFGWNVVEVDGHDISAIIEALQTAKHAHNACPQLIVARTVKGKGVSFMENQAGWHGKAPSAQELTDALEELGAKEAESFWEKACEFDPQTAPAFAQAASIQATADADTPAQGSASAVNAASTQTSASASTSASSLLLDPASEEASSKKATRAAYGTTLAALAQEGLPVVAVDADLTGSTTTKAFAAADPAFASRLFNAGIAEQNMTDIAAGLALTGNIAFTGSFAVFGTGRAYDQIRNTVCYSNLNVKIAPTHAGISVGPDGGSHQMLEDISLMRGLPNMKVLVPADYSSAEAAIRLAAKTEGPVYVRMGRESVSRIYASGISLQIGKANVLRQGGDVSIIACGIEVQQALAAAEELACEGIHAEVIDAFCIKPLDADTILASVEKTGCAVSAEEHSVYGGLGSAVAELLSTNYPVPLEFIGMHDHFGKSGAYGELSAYYEMDAAAIVKAVKRALERK